MALKFFLLAGEASGDMHGANLAKALKEARPDIILHGWGGPKMKSAGVVLHRELKDLSFMGFVEVLKNIGTIHKNFKLIKTLLNEWRPDALVLIDYPGFNLKIAKWAHRQGIKVFYFISPTVWAWKANRALIIKESVDRLYCILPFEVDFYKKLNYDVTYVGNPLSDPVSTFIPNPHFQSSHPFNNQEYIAALPGSRNQELIKIFPVMVRTMALMPEQHFVIARTSLLPEEAFVSVLEQYYPNWRNRVFIATDQTYDVLYHAHSAMVTSGTATLETALFHIPQVVCYSTNPINYHIAKSFVNIKYISLVNLIPDKAIVTELIQADLTPENLKKELIKLEDNSPQRSRILEDYQLLAMIVGEAGVSERMAKDMLQRMG
ncbi:MAG: lipid-A-disaccharide synthase [Bacteroidetes bacterium]|nr:lipid-A-disaccharide synthase [Bacteroidota bacterium]